VKLGQGLLVGLLRFYRWVVSPAKNVILGQAATCRYTPTCSAYALEAIRLHGAGRGSVLTFRRLCRCHPWGGQGDDPVPDLISTDTISPTWTEKA